MVVRESNQCKPVPQVAALGLSAGRGPEAPLSQEQAVRRLVDEVAGLRATLKTVGPEFFSRSVCKEITAILEEIDRLWPEIPG